MKIIGKIIIILQLLLIVTMPVLFGFLIFDDEIKKYEKDKGLFLQDANKLKNNISNVERDILNIFLDDLKNSYARYIDSICKSSKEEFEICLVNNVIDDFKKQDNYSVLKRGKVDINVPFFGSYNLKVMNLIFKNKEIIFDEYCSENKKITIQDIHIHKRDIFNTKTGKIHEFSSNDCHDMNVQWFQEEGKSVSEPKEYEERIGHLPGDFLMYEINHFSTKKYYFDEKFLNVLFRLSDASTQKKYKQYIKFVSGFEPGFENENINFNYVDINFKINIVDYSISEINVIDNYSVKRYSFNSNIVNTLNMFFFYNKTLVDVNETNKVDYSTINCTDYCSNFKINES